MNFPSTTHLFLISLCCFPGLLRANEPLTSGEQIPVGTSNSRGPLATHGVMSFPFGTAHVFGSSHPDLFLATTKYGTQPGLWLYRWVAKAKNGAPVFERAHKIGFPFPGTHPPNGVVTEANTGRIIAVWPKGKSLIVSVLNKETWSFDQLHQVSINGLPRSASSLGLHQNADDTWQVFLGVRDGTPYVTSKFRSRNPAYQPYRGNGIWHGGLPYSALYTATISADATRQIGTTVRVSERDRDIRFGMRQITPARLTKADQADVITGSAMGELHFFRSDGRQHWKKRCTAVAHDGLTHRHPTIYASPTAYPNLKTGYSDLLVGGEGGIYFYRFTGKILPSGRPLFDDPVPALEQNAKLYGGTLPVPNVVDWDGDGQLDIVAGNSEGRVLFLKNAGSNDRPAFLPARPIVAGTEEIHVQPGYRLDIQGPREARWGYTCPTVVDWNQDGILDILMSDSTARHTVFMNSGTSQNPQLAIGQPLYYEGLDMYGTWRVQPGAGRLGDRMAYVALDDQDEFHLYWRIDDQNVVDAGKLKLESGNAIGANFLHGGGSGRLKIILTDWDRDGATDLMVGTPRHGSVPTPHTGLPQSLGLPGAAVLLLKNKGTNTDAKFSFPKVLTFRGEPVFFGQHACGPAIAAFRGTDQADLIVAEEEGRFRYFKREDIRFLDVADIDSLQITPRK